jgi:hypothetical protein
MNTDERRLKTLDAITAARFGEHYEGAHWLATFAVYSLTT